MELHWVIHIGHDPDYNSKSRNGYKFVSEWDVRGDMYSTCDNPTDFGNFPPDGYYRNFLKVKN